MRHLRLYRAIALIVRTGSIRSAAEQLAISPSALNRSIQGFEAELGVEIFERLSSGVRLSVVGELIYGPIVEHLAQIDHFTQTLAEMQGGLVGSLSIAVSEDVSRHILAPALAEYREAAPRVSVHVEPYQGPQTLLSQRIDLAVVSTPEVIDGVTVACARAYPVLASVHPDHPLAAGGIDYSDLGQFSIALPPSETGVRLAVAGAFRRHRLQPRLISSYPEMLMPLRLAPAPEIRFHLGARPGPDAAHPDISGLRIEPVQVSVLHNSRIRPNSLTQRFITLMQQILDT